MVSADRGQSTGRAESTGRADCGDRAGATDRGQGGDRDESTDRADCGDRAGGTDRDESTRRAGSAVGAGGAGRAEGERVAALLGLEPLPDEGGLFRRTHVDAHSAAILYLLLAPDFSAMHRLDTTEVYHWHAGAPLSLLLIAPDGTITEPVLGPGVDRGEVPQLVVPPGTWQGSSSLGAWTLVGTTTAPPFDWRSFHLADRAPLLANHPQAAPRITKLTR